jgi:hypothetical protein
MLYRDVLDLQIEILKSRSGTRYVNDVAEGGIYQRWRVEATTDPGREEPDEP